MSEQPMKNTERELFRETDERGESGYYQASVHVDEPTQTIVMHGSGGRCVARSIDEWVDMAWPKCEFGKVMGTEPCMTPIAEHPDPNVRLCHKHRDAVRHFTRSLLTQPETDSTAEIEEST